MSLDINQIALHQLIKRDEQNLELVLRRFIAGADNHRCRDGG
ncbi:nucleoid-asociated protein [Salmonella enterica subsp. enterica]|uniref:Nucleoid-asociated protein n=1 Tax=Salmonella enterica I TaxID=59201 RepID=A0A379WQ80_SALET|nr:nucleoid-asociated protein [Salmonella enterica subsp. enterica]